MEPFSREDISFQSTPSARRATVDVLEMFLAILISIHALREEGDSPASSPLSPACHFNPRPPRGGRLFGPGYLSFGNYISIHALREEGDALSYVVGLLYDHFNPRPPRGGRPMHLSELGNAS